MCNAVIRFNTEFGICLRRHACREAAFAETRRREALIGYLRVKTICEADGRHDVLVYTGTSFECVCSPTTAEVADVIAARLRAAIADSVLCDRALNHRAAG